MSYNLIHLLHDQEIHVGFIFKMGLVWVGLIIQIIQVSLMLGSLFVEYMIYFGKKPYYYLYTHVCHFIIFATMLLSLS